jgi:TolB-like protein/DNA-binding winged helix-turn-helix (wHTH) protein/Tfp pilus assembly protein PilF
LENSPKVLQSSVNNQTGQLYEFGEFRLEAADRVLFHKGKPVTLTPKALETLLVLVQNGGRLVNKEDLIKAVWADTFVEEANLARNIWTLRKALGDDDTNHRYIETVPKRGYRFVAPVTEVPIENTAVLIQRRVRAHIVSEELETSEEPRSDSQVIQTEDQPIESVAAKKQVADRSADIVMQRHTVARIVTEEEEMANGRGESEPAFESKALLVTVAKEKEVNRRRRLALGAVGVLLVGLTLALTHTWSSRKSQVSATGTTVRSLAVLPFKPIGARDEDDYLGLGMADALITKLSNIREINIRPTSAVRKYGSQDQDPVAAGRELRVEAVIEGSVQRVGEQLRVTVQLVSVRDRAPLWAEKFDERFTDIFAVQDRISEQVARALMPRLTLEDRERLHKRYTENAEAYQAYLKGRFLWNKRTGEGMRKSIEYFDQAVRIDPKYALAYAGLADSYNVLSQFGELASDEAMPKAKAAALKALEIDDTLAEAHASLALVHNVYDWNWVGAETEFKRAIELNPNYANARHWYAMFLSAAGRHDEALAEIRRAKEIDPVSLIISTNEGWILFCARQYDAAIEQLGKTVELDQGFANAHYKLALVYEAKGMYKEAVKEYLKDEALSGTSQEVVAMLRAAYSKSGWEGYCQRQLNQLKKESKEGYVSPKSFVMAYLQLGEKDRAFEWLEKAYGERGELLLYLKVDPRFDPLRSDPRFEDLLRRVGHTP